MLSGSAGIDTDSCIIIEMPFYCTLRPAVYYLTVLFLGRVFLTALCVVFGRKLLIAQGLHLLNKSKEKQIL